jgi:hypothetical protein
VVEAVVVEVLLVEAVVAKRVEARDNVPVGRDARERHRGAGWDIRGGGGAVELEDVLRRL